MKQIAIMAALLGGCAVDAESEPALGELTAELGPGWCNEQDVPLRGFPAGLNVEEPFVRVTPGGTFLYFSDRAPNELRDLYYAVWIDNLGFVYLGAVGPNVNTPGFIEAAPSIDVNGAFYFTNSAVPEMISRGVLGPEGVLHGVAPLRGTPPLATSGLVTYGNMDIGVAPRLPFAVLSRGAWFAGALVNADLWYLHMNSDGSVGYDPAESGRFLGNVTSSALEYAPAISDNGLDLYFTRTAPSGSASYIMVSTRPNIFAPWGLPSPIVANAPGTLIEAPTLLGNRIFFHVAFPGTTTTSRIHTVARC